MVQAAIAGTARNPTTTGAARNPTTTGAARNPTTTVAALSLIADASNDPAQLQTISDKLDELLAATLH